MKERNPLITYTTIVAYVVFTIILGLVLVVRYSLFISIPILVATTTLLALCQNYLIRYRKIEFRTTSHRALNFICLLCYITISGLCVRSENDVLTINTKSTEFRQNIIECKGGIEEFIARENKSLDNMCDSLGKVLRSNVSRSNDLTAWMESHQVNNLSDLNAFKTKVKSENARLAMDGIDYAETFCIEINYLDSISKDIGINNFLYLSNRINTLRQNIESVCRKYDKQSQFIKIGYNNNSMDIVEKTKVEIFNKKKNTQAVSSEILLIISLIPFIFLHILMFANYLSTFIRRYETNNEGITL